MKLTNQQIYACANELIALKKCNIKLPIKVNFYLQKNLQIVAQAAEEIEGARLQIASQYGTLNKEKNGYDIPLENIPIVNRELNDLFNLEQDLNIHIFKLSDFDNIELTYQELSAIMFMIEE